jgi:hypothetical protein
MYEIHKESFAYIVGSDLPHCHRIAYKLVACIQAILVYSILHVGGHSIILPLPQHKRFHIIAYANASSTFLEI